MLDKDLENIGAYFFLSILEDSAAVEACKLAANQYRKRLEVLKMTSSQPEMISICNSISKKFKDKKSTALSGFSENFIWPENVDPNPWREFFRQSNLEQRAAVIWHLALGLSLEDVAKGLGVTTGTIEYRCSHGLTILGKFTRPSLRSV